MSQQLGPHIPTITLTVRLKHLTCEVADPLVGHVCCMLDSPTLPRPPTPHIPVIALTIRTQHLACEVAKPAVGRIGHSLHVQEDLVACYVRLEQRLHVTRAAMDLGLEVVVRVGRRIDSRERAAQRRRGPAPCAWCIDRVGVGQAGCIMAANERRSHGLAHIACRGGSRGRACVWGGRGVGAEKWGTSCAPH
eukprot:365932-Chlamydomonas_euryale.AAC.8